MTFLAAIFVCLTLCAHAQMLTLSPVPLRPVTFEDAAQVNGPWLEVVDNCTNLSVLPDGNRFFRCRLERAQVSLTCVRPGGVDGIRIYNGPAARHYTEHFDFSESNYFTALVTVYPTNHFAATCFQGTLESDFSPEAVFQFTNALTYQFNP
jgi:hypothetical protein